MYLDKIPMAETVHRIVKLICGNTSVKRIKMFAEFAAASIAMGCCTVERPGYDTLVAHRGESVDAPENTLPAYRMAVERGFGFECDIYLSKDGRVFTFHDNNLTRTTSGVNKKKCADAMWTGELEKVDVGSWGKWKGSKFAGTRPALLEEVLALARNGRQIYIEVKTGPEIVPFIKDVFAKQSKATPGNALFITFNEATCKVLKAQMPNYRVYWLVSPNAKSPFSTAEGVVAKLRELGVDGVDCHYKPSIVTAEYVKAIRSAGYEFHVWTVDKLTDTLEAFRRGVQTVTTNCAKKQYDEYFLFCAIHQAEDQML